MYIFCESLRNDYTNQGKLDWLYKMFSAYYKADSFVYKVHTKKKKKLKRNSRSDRDLCKKGQELESKKE